MIKKFEMPLKIIQMKKKKTQKKKTIFITFNHILFSIKEISIDKLIKKM